jgi:phage terminase large subunit-like protein
MCKALLAGEIEDESYFAALYTLDDEDNWQDRSVWAKSNPNLNVTQSIEKLEIDYNQAINKPSEIRNFLTKNLNIYTDTTAAWIEDSHYNGCMKEINFEELADIDCYMGIDLSSNRDLTSVALLWEHNGTFTAHVDFFCTDGTDRNRKGGISLKRWIDQGFIIPTPGITIDFDLIFAHIAKLKERFPNIVACGYDPWNNQLIVPRLQSELGIQCDKFAQTTQNFNSPMKLLERLVVDQEINLPANPVLRWNFRNAVLYQDGNGNIKIMKNKSSDAVDGAVALSMAIGMWIKYNFDEEKMALENWK